MTPFRYGKRGVGHLPHALYVPDGAPPEGGWPLIVFLHGSGERGSDGQKQTTVGLGPAILELRELTPQMRHGLLHVHVAVRSKGFLPSSVALPLAPSNGSNGPLAGRAGFPIEFGIIHWEIAWPSC